MLGWLTNDEWERIWKEAVVAKSRHYPGICLQGLTKTTKNTGQDSWVHGQDSNWAPPEYESRRYR
jgi:hypothetical protein